MKRLTVGIVSLLITFATLGNPAAAQKQAPASATSAQTGAAIGETHTLDISGSAQWVDTQMDLRPGEKLHIASTGTITYPADSSGQSKARSFGPDGLPRGWMDLLRQYPVPSAGHGALIGRLGTGDAAQPFLVGAERDYEAPVAGRLFLGINQSYQDASSAQGSFHVTIRAVAAGAGVAGAAPAGGLPDTPIPIITPALLEKIPRRVSDEQGHPGDMVNLLLVGSRDEVVQAFAAAGWVQVDRSVGETVLTGILNSLKKEDYLTMPMSTLYLFNRPQDFGFAHAEPVRVVMSRNHLRVWKSPFEAGGQPVWCVAATHDIGFERDQRNNGLTHKIDPDVDHEREYVSDTLSGTGMVAARDHVTPKNPLTEAKTATGGSFQSDGRLVVLVLRPSPASAQP